MAAPHHFRPVLKLLRIGNHQVEVDLRNWLELVKLTKAAFSDAIDQVGRDGFARQRVGDGVDAPAHDAPRPHRAPRWPAPQVKPDVVALREFLKAPAADALVRKEGLVDLSRLEVPQTEERPQEISTPSARASAPPCAWSFFLRDRDQPVTVATQEGLDLGQGRRTLFR